MYALARNSWKFQSRDKRINKVQKIEFEPFAPDTIEEILNARRLLEIWTAKANLRNWDESIPVKDDQYLSDLGRELLSGKEEVINGLEVLGENMENTKRKVLILKPYKAYHAYGEILSYYAVKNLMTYISSNLKATFLSMCKDLNNKRQHEWVNLGGQIIPKDDVDKLRADIGSGRLKTWKDIHDRYDKLWSKYTTDKQKHAFAILCELSGKEHLTKADWKSSLDKAVSIQKYVCEQVYITRKKDYDNPFRQATYRNMDEMKAAIGTIDENSFIIQVRKETNDFIKQAEKIKKRG